MARRPIDGLSKLVARPRLRLFSVLVCLFACVVSALVWLDPELRYDLTIAVDGRTLVVKAREGTVGQVLKEAGVSLSPRDEVSPEVDERVAAGLAIEVRRAVPVVFYLDGREIRVSSAAATVGEVIDESRLAVWPDDKVEPGRDAVVRDGLEVVVTRVVKSYQHRQDPIPFQTIRQENTSMDLGQTKVSQEGVEGLESRLLLVTYEDGRQVSSTELKKEVVRRPTPEVVQVGTAGTVVIGGQKVRFLKAFKMRATAYEPGPISCGASADGYTCLGLRATKGIVAVDPHVIPFWTKVYVEGYGYAVAGDSGSAIKGQRIDVCFDTYAEAIAWGVRNVKVYILELPEA